jgi:hypothetical protein
MGGANSSSLKGGKKGGAELVEEARQQLKTKWDLRFRHASPDVKVGRHWLAWCGIPGGVNRASPPTQGVV